MIADDRLSGHVPAEGAGTVPYDKLAERVTALFLSAGGFVVMTGTPAPEAVPLLARVNSGDKTGLRMVRVACGSEADFDALVRGFAERLGLRSSDGRSRLWPLVSFLMRESRNGTKHILCLESAERLKDAVLLQLERIIRVDEPQRMPVLLLGTPALARRFDEAGLAPLAPLVLAQLSSDGATEPVAAGTPAAAPPAVTAATPQSPPGNTALADWLARGAVDFAQRGTNAALPPVAEPASATAAAKAAPPEVTPAGPAARPPSDELAALAQTLRRLASEAAAGMAATGESPASDRTAASPSAPEPAVPDTATPDAATPAPASPRRRRPLGMVVGIAAYVLLIAVAGGVVMRFMPHATSPLALVSGDGDGADSIRTAVAALAHRATALVTPAVSTPNPSGEAVRPVASAPATETDRVEPPTMVIAASEPVAVAPAPTTPAEPELASATPEASPAVAPATTDDAADAAVQTAGAGASETPNETSPVAIAAPPPLVAALPAVVPSIPEATPPVVAPSVPVMVPSAVSVALAPPAPAPAPALPPAAPPAALPPAASPDIAPAAAAPAAASQLNAEEAAVLLRRGEDLLAAGDFVSARLFFTRIGADNARAAIGLARSYDPLFLQQAGAHGVTGNPAKAASWYREAVRLGESRAAEPLARVLARFPQ